MKNKIFIFAVWIAMGAVSTEILTVQAQAGMECTAQCPSGSTQVAGSCQEFVQDQCVPQQCTGMITCQYGSSTTIQSQVPCRCSAGPGVQMM